MMVDKAAAIKQMDEMGQASVPFFFFTDFLGQKAFIKEGAADDTFDGVRFQFNKNQKHPSGSKSPLVKYPVSAHTFGQAFNQVIDEINFGNSFLVNLTFKTPIQTAWSLEEIFEQSSGKYKVLFDNQFVCFSPETFVKIRDGEISSYPMKGTIDADLPNAEELLINNPKELAEHVTIVDLIRNDLSLVAQDVTLTKFRFISEIKTQDKNLLQVSSEIKGKLMEEYHGKIGSTIFSLLPAGSISGAPKNKTIDIIEKAELQERGFYTGVCGYFDGKNLDSGVMIRFIENIDGKLFYRSGGGITSFSNEASEYQEMIDKIYLPM
ncbi:MAG: aminodeoxychorismate synthase component I [Cyclobacteriaceae bacterium]